ncbi:hypothetical protein [Thaumasiovibrio sp. DFM-14]|uniref:hypothetical protein n=1 Tax=Thaumasiovibrio sp. DFM-14 TaxID=3384792 RepID=UPI0039A2EE77
MHKFSFPIAEENGTEFNRLDDFRRLFRGVTSGRFAISQGAGGWHGGLHITDRVASWLGDTHPVRAIGDGHVVAYRMNETYITTQFASRDFRFSNNFCLIRYNYLNPENQEDSFVFYLLYMHLKPHGVLRINSEAHYRAKTRRVVYHESEDGTYVSYAIPPGSIIVFTSNEESDRTERVYDGVNYEWISCYLAKLGPNADTATLGDLVGRYVWIAANRAQGQATDALLNSNYDKVDYSIGWHSRSEEGNDSDIVETGEVIVPSDPIPVESGESIGYAGLHEFPKDSDGNLGFDNRVHLELISEDEPPVWFLNILSGTDNDEQAEHDYHVVDGSGSNGICEAANSFYCDLLGQVRSQEGRNITEADLAIYFSGETNELEKAVIKHPTEWYNRASAVTTLEQLINSDREEKHRRFRRCFRSEEAYQNSRDHNLIEQIFDEQLAHEISRAENLVWIEDAVSAGLAGFSTESDSLSLWHLWPLSLYHVNPTGISNRVIERVKDKLEEYEGRISHMYLDSEGYVTIGVGHYISDVDSAIELSMIVDETGLEATEQEIENEFNTILGQGQTGDRGARYYSRFASLHITRETMDELTDEHLQEFQRGLEVIYGAEELYSYPADVQVALFDMIFNLGQTRLTNVFVNFTAHIRARNFQAAALESRRPQLGDARNDFVRELLENAE